MMKLENTKKNPEFTVSKSFFKLLSDRYSIEIAKKVKNTCSPTVYTHFLKLTGFFEISRTISRQKKH